MTTDRTNSQQSNQQHSPSLDQTTDQHILKAFLSKTTDALRKSKVARSYFEQLDLPILELVDYFSIGYCPHNLYKDLIESEKEKLRVLGLMKDEKPVFAGCVIYPLMLDGVIVNIWGCAVNGNTQKFLYPTKREGLYVPNQGLNARQPVIVTESILDAMSLFLSGVTNVLPLCGINSFWPDYTAYIQKQNFPEIYTLFSGTTTSKKAARALKEHIDCEVIDLPDAKSCNVLLQDFGRKKLKNWISGKLQADVSQVYKLYKRNSFIFIQFEDRVYRVQGLTNKGFERLKVTLKLYTDYDPHNFYMDSVDLYQARSRERLIAEASYIFRLKHKQFIKEINTVITILEEIRLTQKEKHKEPTTPHQMSEREKNEALEYLKSPNLIDRIAEDFEKSGMVGNRREALLVYLGSLSRLTDNPLGILIVSRSGAGKSFLQDMVSRFIPEENLLCMTRLTGQSLFYRGKDGLKRKCISIEEDIGMQDALYSIRTLLSSNKLSLHSLKTEQKTGRLEVHENSVEGPASVMVSTTDCSRFDFESINRFLQIQLDESPEQTTAIVEHQIKMSGIEKLQFNMEKQLIQKRQQNMQRLLKPLTVVNNLGIGITYPTHILNTRREQKKFATLVEVIALLHQHTREIKAERFNDQTIEYIEVVQSDIDMAFELAKTTLIQSLDELSPLGRDLLQCIVTFVETKLAERQKDIAQIKRWQVPFTRRDLTQTTGWSLYHIKQHCLELIDAGFITRRAGKQGQQYTYCLVVDAVPALPVIKKNNDLRGNL